VPEIHPVDLLPFERLKSLATAAYASNILQHFTELRRLYPDDVEEDEARRIHERLCWLLEASLREPVWAQTGIIWEPIPFEPLVPTPWLADIGGLAALQAPEALGIEVDLADPLAGIALGLTQFEAHIAPTLRDLMTRVFEIVLFDMTTPHPPDEPEYGGERRALFLFGKYWESYRSVLDQHGSAQLAFQPHPMTRFIASLERRLREYAERIDDVALSEGLESVLAIELDSDTQDVWEDAAQPQISQLQRAFEEVRVRRGSGAYDLTQAEDLFLQLTAAELLQLESRASVARQGVLNSAAVVAPAAPAPGSGSAEAVPGFRHSPDFRSVWLHEELFSLTTQQAQVVEYLFGMHEGHTPEVAQVTILDAIGAGGSQLRDTFRGAPAWGKLVVPGATRGSFRLNF
jgi:hypothetical protein